MTSFTGLFSRNGITPLTITLDLHLTRQSRPSASRLDDGSSLTYAQLVLHMAKSKLALVRGRIGQASPHANKKNRRTAPPPVVSLTPRDSPASPSTCPRPAQGACRSRLAACRSCTQHAGEAGRACPAPGAWDVPQRQPGASQPHTPVPGT